MGILILFPISIGLGFVILIFFTIIFAIKQKNVIDYLRSKNMQEELIFLEVGMGNIRGPKWVKKFNKFYTTITEDDELNRLKSKVRKQNILNLKALIIWTLFSLISFFLLFIFSILINW